MTATPQLGTYHLDAHGIDWVPAGPGLSFKPLALFPGNSGWAQLLRLEPGTVIPRHRHTGEVHAINLRGHRLLLDPLRTIGPLTYVHESPGDVDSWMAVGDEECVVYVEVHGTVEYLDDADEIVTVIDAGLHRQLYVDRCEELGRRPHPALAEVR